MKHGNVCWRRRIVGGTDPRYLGLLLLLVVFSGCSHPGGNLPEGSYQRGAAEFEGGSMLEAIDDLKLFIRRNPQDPMAPEAQFLVGKAYMETDDYPVAAVEFEILQVDYPRSPLTDDASYLEAMCYVRQVPNYKLDQTITRTAVEKLQNYLRSHPGGKYTAEAQDELRALQGQLDLKRFEAAEFYKKRGFFDASHQVLENVMQDSPDSPIRPRMLLLMGELDTIIGNYDAARRSLQEIITRWPDSPYAHKAEGQMKDLEEAEQEDES